MAKPRIIKLCEGHKGGFGLLKAVSPTATYRDTPVTKLKVVLVDRGESCVQCEANQRARKKRGRE